MDSLPRSLAADDRQLMNLSGPDENLQFLPIHLMQSSIFSVLV